MSDFQDIHWRSGDGLELYARDYRAEGTATPVVCLHGLTRNSRDFEALAPRIQALGRRVLVPELRGRGRSDYDPDPQRYLPPVYADDIRRLCDDQGVARLIAIGTSLGGLVTMILATMAPERLAGAVLNDIGPVIDEAGLKRIRSYVGKSRTFDNWEAAAAAVRNVNAAIYPEFDDADWLTVESAN